MRADLAATMLRGLDDAQLGALVKELSDEQLMPILRSVLDTEPRREQPTAKMRVELAGRRKAPPAPASASAKGSSGIVDAVYRVLVGSDAVSRADIIEKTRLTKDQVGYALAALKEKKRAFVAGRTQKARWAITQQAANEAAGK